MKHVRLISFIAFILLSVFPCKAQKHQTDEYNLKKAYEVLQKDKDEDQALELLAKQLSDTPNNVEALLLRARIYRNKEEYGNALSDLNEAITANKPSKSGIENSTLFWWRATVYSEIDELEKSANDYKTALKFAQKDGRENIQQISFDYAQALFELKQLNQADEIYRQMLKTDESDQAAMVGLARNMMERKQYKEAIDLMLKSKKYGEEYTGANKFLMFAYQETGEIEKAIDMGIEYCEKDSDALASDVLSIMMNKYSYSLAKVKAQIKKTEKPIYWKAFLGRLYEKNNQFELAIKVYDEIEKDNGKDSWIYSQRADCYDELGLTAKAIEEITLAMGNEPDYYSLITRADYYRKAGQYDEAIKDFSAAIEEKPDHSFGYYRRGWCYELSGNNEKAMEEYNMGIEIDSDYPYLYLMRAELLLAQGEKEKANIDFEQVLQRDTIPNSASCRQYALHFLGRDEEAIQWMDKIINEDPQDKGNYYDKACLYSRMGKYDEAMEAFAKCLELGYCHFGHLEHDDDLDGIRNRDDFKEAVKEAKEKVRIRLEQNRIDCKPLDQKTIEVAIAKHSGGTFEVPCVINGLPLQMIFDTGASDVTISSIEANFMLKNNYLSSKDIKGKKYYQIANGQIAEGTVVTLKEVHIGEAVLQNIDASVVKGQQAPLLLGQSALERFGTITIDNVNNKLIIRQ